MSVVKQIKIDRIPLGIKKISKAGRTRAIYIPKKIAEELEKQHIEYAYVIIEPIKVE